MTDQLPIEQQPTTVTPTVNGSIPVGLGPVEPTVPAPFVESTGWPAAEPSAEPPAEPPAEPLAEPPAAPAAPPSTAPPAATETVTCPECGTVAVVTLNRRESHDFCRNCDYPLFWTPSAVFIDRSDVGDESLRRLPGTVGRATIASLPCPHCAEPNAVSAVDCVRCGLPMHPVAPPPPPPPPAPVYVPPPPPVVVEPEPRTPWAWVIAGVVLLSVLVVLALYLTNTIG